MYWFDIGNIAFEILGYPLSYIELVGTVVGFISVVLAAKGSIWTWPTGIINEAAFFLLFFQVQLYSDMYLQVFFFGVTLYGWYYWKSPNQDITIYKLPVQTLFMYLAALVIGTLATGYLISDIHILLPDIFSQPASYPYADALTTIASILATFLLARKRIETWFFWMLVDIVSIALYVLKGVNLVAIEYFIFLLICVFGYFNWKKKL